MKCQSAVSFLATLGLLVAFVAAAPTAHAQERWEWSVTPYFWGSNISEDLLLRGEISGGSDTQFKDLVSKLDFAMQVHVEAIKGHWGPFADLSYIALSDSETGEQGILRLDVEIKELLGEAGAIYRPGGREGRLDLLFGARLLSVDELYRLGLADLGSVDTSVDENYLDALVGARYSIPLSESWAIVLRGDVSFGSTDYMWTAQGLLGWRFGSRKQSSVFLGYRYRDMKYTKADVIEVEKTLNGVGLGVQIGF